jgi:hypothetical protein
MLFPLTWIAYLFCIRLAYSDTFCQNGRRISALLLSFRAVTSAFLGVLFGRKAAFGYSFGIEREHTDRGATPPELHPAGPGHWGTNGGIRSLIHGSVRNQGRPLCFHKEEFRGRILRQQLYERAEGGGLVRSTFTLAEPKLLRAIVPKSVRNVRAWCPWGRRAWPHPGHCPRVATNEAICLSTIPCGRPGTRALASARGNPTCARR